jgi:hypothetical protein
LITTVRGQASLGARLQHHAVDAGQLLAAGFVVWGVTAMTERAAARLLVASQARWPRALVLGVLGFAVALLLVPPDVTNAAARYGKPVWTLSVAVACLFGAGAATTGFLPKLRWQPLRIAIGVAGVACGAANAFVLPGDYAVVHLLSAWFSALLIASAVEGATLRSLLTSRARLALFGALAVLGFVAVVARPPQAVRRRLYALPSSVLAPFVARLYPTKSGTRLELIRRDVLNSPWFHARDELPPVAGSNAIVIAEPRIVLLLTVDAMRADVVSKKEHLARLPTFTKMHERCAYFSKATSTASSTRAAIGAMLFGQYHPQYRSTLTSLNYDGPRLQTLVAESGANTASFPGARRIRVAAGITAGFAHEFQGRGNGAGTFVDGLIESVEPSRRGFYYAHFMEPHAPYRGTGSSFERYVQEVMAIDGEFARLFEHLEKAGLADNTLVVVSADHGEAFGEHGVKYHQRVIYEEVAHVPLFICGPGVRPRSIEERVSLVDIAPTVLDAFGIPIPGLFMGQSLLPLASGGNEPLERPVAVHATHGLAGYYFRDGKKVIFDKVGKSEEVYDLNSDPDEAVNLADRDDPAVRSAIETARFFFQQLDTICDNKCPPNAEPTDSAAAAANVKEGEE